MQTSDEEFHAEVVRAVDTIQRATGRTAADVVDDYEFAPPNIAVARALGFLDGAASALGVTPLELIDEVLE